MAFYAYHKPKWYVKFTIRGKHNPMRVVYKREIVEREIARYRGMYGKHLVIEYNEFMPLHPKPKPPRVKPEPEYYI